MYRTANKALGAVDTIGSTIIITTTTTTAGTATATRAADAATRAHVGRIVVPAWAEAPTSRAQAPAADRVAANCAHTTTRPAHTTHTDTDTKVNLRGMDAWGAR